MKTAEDFIAYINESRNEFVSAINQQDWNTQLRTAAESLLICFDQMKDRLEETTSIADIAGKAWDSGWQYGHADGAEIMEFTNPQTKEQFIQSLNQ